jgi:hypothetical protein
MSREQWGHGFHTGMERAQAAKLKKGFVGLFFHTFKPDGRLDWQGVIRKRVTKDKYLATLFSWMDGSPNGNKLVAIEDNIALYMTAAEMREAFARFAEQGLHGVTEAWPGATRKYEEMLAKRK